MAKSKSLNNSGNNMFSVLNTEDDDDEYVKGEKDTTPILKNKKKNHNKEPQQQTVQPTITALKNKKEQQQQPTKTAAEVVPHKQQNNEIIKNENKQPNKDKKLLEKIENEREETPSLSMFNQIVTIFICVLLTIICYASEQFIGVLISKVGAVVLLLFTLYLTKELVMPAVSDTKKFKTLYVINQLKELRIEKQRLKEKPRSTSTDKQIAFVKKRINELETEFEQLDTEFNNPTTTSKPSSTPSSNNTTNNKNNKNKIKSK